MSWRVSFSRQTFSWLLQGKSPLGTQKMHKLQTFGAERPTPNTLHKNMKKKTLSFFQSQPHRDLPKDTTGDKPSATRRQTRCYRSPGAVGQAAAGPEGNWRSVV